MSVRAGHGMRTIALKDDDRGLDVGCWLFEPPPGRLRRGNTLLWLHGGGWSGGSGRDDARLLSLVCEQLGITVVAVDYRLAPDNPFPCGLQDCVSTYRSLREGVVSIDHGCPSDVVVVGGISAGANLAAATCLTVRDLGVPAPSGQILVCAAVAGMRTERFGSGAAYGTGFGNDLPDRLRYWEDYVGGVEDPYQPHICPLYATDLSGLPEATIITASDDPLRDEAEAFGLRLLRSGVKMSLFRQERARHGDFGGDDSILLRDENLRDVFLRAVGKHLR